MTVAHPHRRTLAEARAYRRWKAAQPDLRTQFVQTAKPVERGQLTAELFNHRMIAQNFRCAGCQKRCCQRRRLAAAADGQLYCTWCMHGVDAVRAYQLSMPRKRPVVRAFDPLIDSPSVQKSA